MIGPSPRLIEFDDGWTLEPGRGTVLREGSDATVFSYGPVMLHEALVASERLAARGLDVQVVDLPWLNRFDPEWLADTAGGDEVFVLEDHSPVGGLGDGVRAALARPVRVFGVEGWPACGTPHEALRAHGLDGPSLADRIAVALRTTA